MMLVELPPAWIEAALVLVLGSSLMIGCAALLARCSRSAAWQRAFWRVSVLGLLVLLAAEATGASNGAVQWWRTIRARTAREASLAGQTRAPPGSEPARRHLASMADEPERAESAAEGSIALSPDVESGGEASAASSGRAHLSADAGTAGNALLLRTVWLAGAAVLFARLAWGRWLLWRFRRRQAAWVQPHLLGRVKQLSAGLGRQRRVEVLSSSCLAAPIAFGCLRPTIVLPAGFSDDFDPLQQDTMLVHELAHLTAGDPVWQLLADLAAAVLWWHPLVWWARRQLCRAGEVAADEASLLVPQGPTVLAGCLVVVARRLEQRPRLAWLTMTGSESRSALSRRVERLLSLPGRGWSPPSRRRLGIVTAIVSLALFLVAVSCTAWARTRAPVAEGVPAMKLFVDCWRQSLAAVTLAAVVGPAAGDTPRVVAAEGEREARSPQAASASGERATDRADSGVRLFDDFDGGLTLPWEPLRPDPTHVSFTKRPGALTIVTQTGSILRAEQRRSAVGGVQAKNIYLLRNPFEQGEDFVAITCLVAFSPQFPWQQAGLIVYDDDDNYLKWTLEASARSRTGAAMVCIHETRGEPYSALFETERGRERLWLKLIKRGNCYQHSYSLDGERYVVLGEEVWGDGTPQRVGLLAKNAGSAAETDASFDFFEIRTLTAGEEEHAAEKQRLQGGWELIADRPGSTGDAPDDVLRLDFNDRSLTVRRNGGTFTAQYTIDAARNPKELILAIPGNWQNKKPQRIAYTLNRDLLTICFDPQTEATGLAVLQTKEGEDRILTTLRRVAARD